MYPLILREFDSEKKSHFPTERSSFYGSQLKNLDVVYVENQETHDSRKVFEWRLVSSHVVKNWLNTNYNTKNIKMNET